MTLIYTDQKTHLNFAKSLWIVEFPRRLRASVVGVSVWLRLRRVHLQVAECFRLLLDRRRSLLFRDRVIDDDFLHALVSDHLGWLRRRRLRRSGCARRCLPLKRLLPCRRSGKRGVRRFAVIFPLR